MTRGFLDELFRRRPSLRISIHIREQGSSISSWLGRPWLAEVTVGKRRWGGCFEAHDAALEAAVAQVMEMLGKRQPAD